MNRPQSLIAARGLTDDQDRLIHADEPLAQLQEACGGRLPGALAVPELRELVGQCRSLGLRIAREFEAFDGRDRVSGFVRIRPIEEQDESLTASVGGCEILIENWAVFPIDEDNSRGISAWHDAADRACAEVTARLDARQNMQVLTSYSHDARALPKAFEASPGKIWTDYVELVGIAHKQPLHWRLLDGAKAKIAGSTRGWRVRLFPVGSPGSAPIGFELALIASEPAVGVHVTDDQAGEGEPEHSRMIGSALTPVLRQPIARIIANAETIHSRLAGPLREEYSDYAGNIAAAGEHLSGMLDDLADLEVVEAPGFRTAKERVDLADVAGRAAGILGVRAQDRGITVSVEHCDQPVFAFAEFRRVLQILINLIGNAIAYSPENSDVRVTIAAPGDTRASVTVSDQGPGVTQDQAIKIFEKFERLGRDSDGGNDTGSGLGLFISRKLALAMDGDLEVLPPSSDDELAGAQFKLSLPVFAPQ